MRPPSYMRSNVDRNVIIRRSPGITVPLQNHFAFRQRLLAYPIFCLNSNLPSHQEQRTRKTSVRSKQSWGLFVINVKVRSVTCPLGHVNKLSWQVQTFLTESRMFYNCPIGIFICCWWPLYCSGLVPPNVCGTLTPGTWLMSCFAYIDVSSAGGSSAHKETKKFITL